MGVLCKPISRHFYHYGRLFFMVFQPHFFASQKCPDFRVSRWGFCNFTTFLSLWQTFFMVFQPHFLRPKNVPILGSVDGGFAISRHFYHYGRLFSWFFNPIFCASQKCPNFRVSRWGFCVSQFHDISIIMEDFFIEWGTIFFMVFQPHFLCVPKMSRF